MRAANLDERFDRTGGAAIVIDYGTPGNPTENITIVQGGNPAVKPETADTVTAGIVYRPQWLPGADLSVDWFDTSLKNAIQAYTAQQIVTACYQQGNTDQCANISRNPDGTIFIVNQTYQNIAKAAVGGVDIESGYTHGMHLLGGGAETSPGVLSPADLMSNTTTSSNGVETEFAGDVGTLGLPNWKVTAYLQYANGPFTHLLRGALHRRRQAERHRQSQRSGTSPTTTCRPSRTTTCACPTTSPWEAARVQLYGVINNIFDKAPPIAPSYVALSQCADPDQPEPVRRAGTAVYGGSQTPVVT